MTFTAEQENEIQAQAFDQGTKVAQAFSGIFFTGLAIWLTITNGTKLAFVRRASLEKRLTVCCFLNTYVGFLSAFLNFFQLTQVDDAILPHQDQFVLDLSRPIEWVLTCPLMQLILVLMGGPKIPEYRMYMMPMFSVCILCCGTTSMFMSSLPVKAVFYACGVCLFCTMAYFNREQIIEYSNGDEGLLSGDSEFRKATLLLLITWVPFPTWFIMSPEGFGIINNVLLIQVGWAFLNIVAKFVYAFYIQRIKDLYCNRLKTKRELSSNMGANGQVGRIMPGQASPMVRYTGGTITPSGEPGEFTGPYSPQHDAGAAKMQAYELSEVNRKKSQLIAVTIETLSYLGMAQHTDRFTKLLERAEICSIEQVEQVTEAQAMELQLPWDLVSALQRRLRVWKLEMVDDAEMGLDKGEEHYFKKAMDEGVDYNDAPAGMGGVMMGGEPSFGLDDVKNLVTESETRILEAQQNNFEIWEGALKTFASNLQVELQGVTTQLSKQVEQALQAQLQHQPAVPFKRSTSAETNADPAALQPTMPTGSFSHVYEKVDECSQKIDMLTKAHEEQALRVASLMKDNGTTVIMKMTTLINEQFGYTNAKAAEVHDESSNQARQGFDLVLQKVESMAKAQYKNTQESDSAWRRRLDEMENSMTCREDEFENSLKTRHEDFMRCLQQTLPRKIDELSVSVQTASSRSDAAFETIGGTIQAELTASGNKLASKVESLQTFIAKQNSEFDANLHHSLENTISLSVTQAVSKSNNDGARRLEKNLEVLDSSMQKTMVATIEKATTQLGQANERVLSRQDKVVEEAAAKAASDVQQHALSQAARATEKAMQDFANSHRSELQNVVSTLSEKFEDQQAAGQRRQAEREERNTRRFEEILDGATSRCIQKTEDTGLELKKEVHGFAKRLNSKLHFL